jgi:HAMP domain-containing protein
MASNLTAQVRNIADVTTAVANGDLGKKITVSVKGEILQIKNTINTMVDQLNTFAGEVTRVAREVGTDGQARRPGRGARRGRHLEGPHRLGQLHGVQPHRSGAQHRRRHHAVANGDLSKKITVDVKGEVLELKNTINTMVGSAQRVRQRGHPRGARGGHRGAARAGKPSSRAWAAPGRTSPTTST